MLFFYHLADGALLNRKMASPEPRLQGLPSACGDATQMLTALRSEVNNPCKNMRHQIAKHGPVPNERHML
jgi:hypothetical protein